MSFYQELPYPVFVGTGAVLTSGGTENLKPGQLALVNASTYQAIGAGASPVSNPSVLVAQGSWHSQDSLSKFIGGLTQSSKTQDFKAKDVLEFHRSYPVALSQDIVQIGWDGVNPYNSLSFEFGKSYFFKVSVSGEDVFRTYSRPLYRFVELRTDCPSSTDECSTTCADFADPTYWSKKLADLINSDVELKYFVKAEAVNSNYSAPSATHNVYNLQVCDNGDVVALSAVQTAYSTLSVTRIARAGSTSTYQVITPIGAGAPSNFTPTGSILLAVCGTCPSGYTSVASKDYYIVRRAIAGTENFAGGTTTFTNTVNTDYSTTGSIFLGQDASFAVVQISVAAGTTVTAVKDDVVTLSHTNQASCTPPAGSAIAWSLVATEYLPSQNIYLTLLKTCGGSNQLSAIQAFYANDPIIVASSIAVYLSGTCGDTYIAGQYATTPLTDDCLSPAPATYGSVQSFNGFSWTTTPPAGTSSPAAPSPAVYSGVRILGAYADTRFGNCSFQPTDYFSTRPLRIRVTQVDASGNPCTPSTQVTIMQNGTVATQTGEWLIRQYLKANSLEAYNIWSNDPRTREIYDQQVLSFIDRTTLYKVYYLVYNMDRFNANWTNTYPRDKFETIIAFPVGADTTTFENVFGGFFSQVGVNLVERDI
jgi:hypothetical protein